MTTNQHKRWAWATVALLAGSAFAQEPPLPVAAPPVNDQQVVPAVVLPPQPVLPAPVILPTEPELEPVGHRGARLQRPIAVPMNSGPVVATTQVPWPTLTMPTTTSAGPQWRWYGWGAANSAGIGKTGTPVDATLNVLPAPTPTTAPTDAPKTPPPTGLISDVKIPEPSWNQPPKTVTATPPTIAPEVQAPKLTPPNLDLNLQAPKPAPNNVPPNFDPWTGINGPGAKADGPRPEVVAATQWKTVRAASK